MTDSTNKKDAWDKAQIISGFLSTVVIAGVGLLISSLIQRARIASADANSRAQIDATERNNKAQLTLQEGRLTDQFAEQSPAAPVSWDSNISMSLLRRCLSSLPQH